jgi:tape measure domain-containing protein
VSVEVAKIRAVVEADLSNFSTAMNRAGKQLDETGAKGEEAGEKIKQGTDKAGKAAEGLTERLTKMGTALSAMVTVPLVALGKASVDAAVRMDGLKRGLVAVTGSAEEAERQFAELKEVAKLPGLGLEEALRGSINLQAAGLSADLAKRSLMAFGNALATVGKGKADLDGVILALSQIQSKGKVSAEEINQLAERVPQIRAALQAAFGTADTEAIQKMGISSEQAITRIVSQLEKAKKATGGLSNEFENAADSINESLTRIGDAAGPVAARLLNRLAGEAQNASRAFSDLPGQTQELFVVLGAGAAAAGPIALMANQVRELASALGAARLAAVGPYGLAAAIAVLAGLKIADLWTQNSQGGIKAAESPAFRDMEAQIRDLRQKITERQEAIQSLRLKYNNGSDYASALNASDKDIPGLKDQLTQLQSLQTELGNVSKAYASVHAAAERGNKNTANARAAAAAAAAARQRAEALKAEAAAATANLQAHLDGLRKTVALGGDQSQEAAMRYALLHGEFSKADPKVKALAISLAQQADALKKNAEAAAAAKAHAEMYAASLRGVNQQLALSRIDPDDPLRAVKQFDIEQRYADPKDKLSEAEAAQIRHVLTVQAGEEAIRKARKETADALRDVTKDLEKRVRHQEAEYNALLTGEKELTELQRVRLAVADLLASKGASQTPYMKELVRRLEEAAVKADTLKKQIKDVKEALGGEREKKAFGNAVIDTILGAVGFNIPGGIGGFEAVLKAQDKATEAATKSMLKRLKEFSKDQRREIERYEREVNRVADSVQGVFRTAFDEAFSGRIGDSARNFTRNFGGMLRGMLADLAANQMRNVIKAAVIDPIAQQMSAAISSGLQGVKLTLGAVQMSVGAMMSQIYSLLALTGAMGRRQQKGALWGTILGGIAGSLIPGIGWFTGATTLGSLFGAASSGNTGQMLIAGMGAVSALDGAGIFGRTSDLSGLNGAFGSGGAAPGTGGPVGGTISGRSVNVNNNFYGPVGASAEEVSRQSARGIEIGLRTPAAAFSGGW